MSKLKAVLFDIDGTMMDNNAYHKEAWKRYLKEQGKDMSDEDFKENISGRTNYDATQHIFGREMSDEEASKYYMKKEEIYRELYEPHIAPIKGLEEFVEDLKKHDINIAIATSGIQVNIDFMFEYLPLKPYFKAIIQAKDIDKGKPDPQIFTKAAEAVNTPPENCVVFEDSISGVEAAKAAGMKVVALTTSEKPEELNKADLIIKDYTEVSYEKIAALL